MLRALVVAITIFVFVWPSYAAQRKNVGQSYSCEAVRLWVRTVGRERAERIAKARGITPKQLRRAKSCLKPGD